MSRYAIFVIWRALPTKFAKKGHKILTLNIGDPINFDFPDSGALDRGGLPCDEGR